MTTDAPSTARLLELAKNCDDLSEFYASAKHPDTVEPARRYADIAAALRALVKVRELVPKWAEDSCDLAPFECAAELTAIIGADGGAT